MDVQPQLIFFYSILFYEISYTTNIFFSKIFPDFPGRPDFRLNEPVDPNLCTKINTHKFAFTGTFWWKHPMTQIKLSKHQPLRQIRVKIRRWIKTQYGWVSCEVVGCIVSITPFLEYCTAC